MQSPAPSHRPLLAGRGLALRCGLLVLLSVFFGALLEMAHMPAALLLGPMFAAVVVAAMGANLWIPAKAFMFGQCLIGLLIARSFSPAMLGAVKTDWFVLLLTALAVVGASTAVGWVLARMRILPGSTAIWGLSPGAATTMVIMSESFGADIRLVAFMQYLRVVMVVVVASVVSTFWVAHSGSLIPAVIWFPPTDPVEFAATVALGLAGAVTAKVLRIPAGSVLVPMAFGGIAHGVFGMPLQLPPWFLACSYALVGWSIGLRFNRAILLHAARALLPIALATLVLIIICGGLAWLLHVFAGIDPLSAYLATSPGGVDAVAIIAASAKVNVSFVMSMQLARLIVVIVAGPPLTKYVASLLPAEVKAEEQAEEKAEAAETPGQP
ncbi:MAG TPA: AbrB family transcriptional regulator [Burkholderiales bacterium]|nr:AbrB family transcriptional regulator [Burkholderiales bacterium]